MVPCPSSKTPGPAITSNIRHRSHLLALSLRTALTSCQVVKTDLVTLSMQKPLSEASCAVLRYKLTDRIAADIGLDSSCIIKAYICLL